MSIKLINIGFGNIVSANRIISIVSPDSAPIKRIIQEARERSMLIDTTYGRRTRAVIITDSDPGANSAWRQQLHPRGFSLVIIDKDGQVKQRRPLPWDVREISRAIDKLPLRRQEIGRAGLLP